MSQSAWHRLGRFAAIDAHVLATLVLRGWSIVAGAVTVLLIPLYLSAPEQGYYFTFASLLALQLFFDLGFNQVLIQFVGRHMPALHWADNGRLEGDAPTLARLGSLVRTIKKVYAALAALFLLAVGAVGLRFFEHFDAHPPAAWMFTWLLMTLFTAGNLYVSPLLAMVEGSGRVGEIAKMRTWQSITGYSLTWLGLSLGWGLLAVPFIAAMNFCGSAFWLWRQGRFLTALARAGQDDAAYVQERIRWRRDILPFQWRMAVSWISGYLIFQLFNPMLFANHGPAEAGRVGLALALFNALVTLAMSWVNTSAPVFASLLGAHQTLQAQRRFRQQFSVSTAVNLLLCVGFLVSAMAAQALDVAYADRLPEWPVLLCIALATISNQIVFALAVYMRAHGREPLLAPSVITGLATAAVLTLTSQSSIFLTMAAYTAVQTLICLPWVLLIFRKRFWLTERSTPATAP